MKALESDRKIYYPKPCGKDRSRKDSRRTASLFRAYREEGDAAALDTLYHENLRLVELSARKYTRRPADYDDLYQEASLGLLEAIKRYDPNRGVEFATYATYYTEGAVKQYFRDKSWPCSAPRSVKSLSLRVRDMKRQLGRDPTRQEVLDAGIIPPDKVDRAIAAALTWSSVYLEDQSTAGALSPSLTYEDCDLELLANRLDVRSAVIKSLDPEELKVVYLHYYQELSKKEIAQLMDTNENHVKRLLIRATRKLGRTLGESGQQAS